MSEDTVVVAGHGSSTEGLQVSLHPLPLLSISEHYTRVRIQSQSSDGGRAGSTSRGDRNKGEAVCRHRSTSLCSTQSS